MVECGGEGSAGSKGEWVQKFKAVERVSASVSLSVRRSSCLLC